MIFPIKFGSCWSLNFLAEKAFMEELQRIIANLSMPYFGFYELALLGVISLPIMAIGKIHIVVFADGATRLSGNHYWRS
jgi:hypothetical protein